MSWVGLISGELNFLNRLSLMNESEMLPSATLHLWVCLTMRLILMECGLCLFCLISLLANAYKSRWFFCAFSATNVVFFVYVLNIGGFDKSFSDVYAQVFQRLVRTSA